MIRQIVYFSTASRPQDAVVAAAILAVSRPRNRIDGITGLLMAGGNRYLQVFEGPTEVVADLERRIRADDRHVAMSILVDRDIPERHFSDWSMAYIQAPQLRKFATLGDLAGVMWDRAGTQELREEIECFLGTFSTAPPPVVWPTPPVSVALDRRRH